MHVSIQIIIAALSVLGFYFSLKTLASLIFTSKQIAASVVIESEKQLIEIDMLLGEASSALFASRRKRLLVIVSPYVWNTCEEKVKNFALEMIDRFGAELYLCSTADK